MSVFGLQGGIEYKEEEEEEEEDSQFATVNRKKWLWTCVVGKKVKLNVSLRELGKRRGKTRKTSLTLSTLDCRCPKIIWRKLCPL